MIYVFLLFVIVFSLLASFLELKHIKEYAKQEVKLNSHQSLDVIGVPVTGYESDYLLLSNQDILGICSLLKTQGVQSISAQEELGFQSLESNLYTKKYRDQYKEKNGKEFPPVYKFELNINAIELSEEEASEFWKNQIIDEK
jgi:hypothetical protein